MVVTLASLLVAPLPLFCSPRFISVCVQINYKRCRRAYIELIYLWCARTCLIVCSPMTINNAGMFIVTVCYGTVATIAETNRCLLQELHFSLH